MGKLDYSLKKRFNNILADVYVKELDLVVDIDRHTLRYGNFGFKSGYGLYKEKYFNSLGFDYLIVTIS